MAAPVISILPVWQPGEHLSIQLLRVLVPLLFGVRLDQHLVQLLANPGDGHLLSITRAIS